MLQDSRPVGNILSVNQGSGATAQTGPAYTVTTAPGNPRPDQQTFEFIASVKSNGGATTPTCQAKVQGSYDKVTWFDITAGTVWASDNVNHAEIMPEVSNSVLPPYIRAITLLAGGTPPTLQAVTVSVVSSSDAILALG